MNDDGVVVSIKKFPYQGIKKEAMIYRKIGFDVAYKTAEGWQRERVREVKFSEGSGYDEAITVSGKTVQLTPAFTALLQFTGQFDIDAAPIFHGHLLIDQDELVWECVFVEGAFMYQQGEKLMPASTANSMTLRIIGDAIRNEDMIPLPEGGIDKLTEQHD